MFLQISLLLRDIDLNSNHFALKRSTWTECLNPRSARKKTGPSRFSSISRLLIFKKWIICLKQLTRIPFNNIHKSFSYSAIHEILLPSFPCPDISQDTFYAPFISTPSPVLFSAFLHLYMFISCFRFVVLAPDPWSSLNPTWHTSYLLIPSSLLFWIIIWSLLRINDIVQRFSEHPEHPL